MQKEKSMLESEATTTEYYFPTMIFKSTIAGHSNLKSILIQEIRKERDRDEVGLERSNFRSLGGWHSGNNLHTKEVFKPVADQIHMTGREISKQLGYHKGKQLRIESMWSIINPPGGANGAHIHPGSHWSGVYYVQTPENCGDIEFFDPRTAHVMNEPVFESTQQRKRENWTKVRFTPKPGRVLIFPSWLYHSVHPNCSNLTGLDSERVIMSFNLSQRSL